MKGPGNSRAEIGVDAAMDAILADIFPESRIGYPVIFARFVGAILLGGIIGFEREAKNRPAGLKTHIMVALAAAVFSIISIEAIYTAALSSDSFKPDPLRVIEAVTAGVAFLAAGTIVLSRGEIHGITILFFVGFMESRLGIEGSVMVDTDEVPTGDPPKGG